MTDATPVNRYLLFSRSDDFRTIDKVTYALRHNSLLQPTGSGTPSVGGQAFTQDLDRHILIKSLDDVKRHFFFGDRIVPLTPATGNSTTFSAAYETAGLEEMDSAYTALEVNSPLARLGTDEGLQTSPLLLEETQDIDTKPWDDFDVKGSYWNWPIESLYQRYHLVLAVDFGQASFDVSENGTVFIDRVPSVVESLLHVLRTTVETRDEEVAHCRRWLHANVMDESLRASIAAQVWHPTICVSIVLLNAPLLPSASLTNTMVAPFGVAAVPATQSAPTSQPHDTDGGETANALGGGTSRRIMLFPPEHAPTSFLGTAGDGDGSGMDTSSSVSCIPLLSDCDARLLLADDTFAGELQNALQRYEDVCRQAGPAVVQSWPQSSLSGSLEYLIRASPECSSECYSIVLVNNTAALACTESLAFLESTVRRKNIILSVVSLNRRTHFDSVELSPLSQFLFSVGGFAVHVDYWLAMATTRLNRDWCRRFEGARCVAQQLFVHLVAAFPVSSHGITRAAALVVEKEDSVVLYDGDHGLPDQIWSGPTDTLVRIIAASRFNEGWSVLIDYKDETTEAVLMARRQHTFYSGSLTLHYELRVNLPVVYRQVRITGTKALVDYFHRSHVDTAWREQSLQEAGTSWFVTLSILHTQLESWMGAEQVVLQLLSNPAHFTHSRDLQALSNSRGLAIAWVNTCTVRAVASFVQYDQRVMCQTLAQISPALSRYTGGGASLQWNWGSSAWRLLRDAILRDGHRPLSDGDDMTFVRLGEDGVPLYVIQCLPFTDAAEKTSRLGSGSGTGGSSAQTLLAGGFECRMSFFCLTAAYEDQLARGLVERLNRLGENGGGTPQTDTPLDTAAPERKQRSEERRLVLYVTDDPQSLLLVEMVTNRRPLVLLANVSHLRSQTAALLTEPLARSRLGVEPVYYASGGTPETAKMSAFSVVQYFRHASRIPFAVAPTQLLDVYVAAWTFGSPEAFSDFSFAEEAFFLAVLRRLNRGFTLLYCNTTTFKAILRYQEPLAHWTGSRTVSVRDVLEVRETHDGGGGAGGGYVLSVQRCVSPHFYVILHPHKALRDIREDFHIATALQSYRVCATVPDGASVSRSQGTARAMQKAGMLVTSLHLESLVRYLSAAHTTSIELSSPSSLHGDRANDLRGRVIELLGNIGDRSASIAATQFNSAYVQRLTQGTEPVPRHYRVQTSILAPLRHHTLTLLLVLEQDTPSGAASHTVMVAVASLDLALLRYGLVRQYAPNSAQPLPECTVDRTVLQALQHLLLTFASLHTTQQLIYRLTQTYRGEGEEAERECVTSEHSDVRIAAERRQLEEEITKSYTFMRTYTVEVDVTHLLHALRLKRTASTASPALVKQTLATLLDSFTTHATPRSEIFFPVCHKGSDNQAAKAATPLSPATPHAAQPTRATEAGGPTEGLSPCGFPTVIRLAATLSHSTDKNVTTNTFWVSHSATAADSADAQTGGPLTTASGASSPTTSAAPATPVVTSPSTAHPSQQRLRVRLFIKTLPREVSSLFRGTDVNGLKLSQAPVRELLRTLIIRYSSGRSAITPDPMDTDFTVAGRTITEKDVERMQNLCTESANVGEPLERILKGLQSRLVTAVARYCMTRAFHTSVFQRLRQLVVTPDLVTSEAAVGSTEARMATVGDEGGESQVPRVHGGGASGTPVPSNNSGNLPHSLAKTSPRHGASSPHQFSGLQCLAQTNSTASKAMREDKELASLLRRVVLPSLLSSKTFVKDSFPVTFTQQATDFRSIDPVAATADVFRRCVEEDNMGVIAVPHHTSYVYVPNAAHFGDRWIAVQVDPNSPESTQSTGTILCYEPTRPPLWEESLGAEPSSQSLPLRAAATGPDTATATHGGAASPCAGCASVMDTVTEKLRAHINAKVTQVSQLHLLRQLRDTQFANAELLPDNWGNQFRSLTFATSRMGEEAAVASSVVAPESGTATHFYLHGSNVLTIPIYYKLQHQCKKILNRITANCSRLELIQVFNRDQCFVVADDVEGDTFHYIRLVFCKDTGFTASVTAPPPQVIGTDRYSKLVVQLFTATTNASIKRPLQKLQDFCYFLAVQELQAHVNYVQHKMISFNDLVFLQNQKLEPITLDLRQIVDANTPVATPGGATAANDLGDDASDDSITTFAMALLFLNLRENKFKRFEIQRDQSHAVSNFVEHYNLEEGLRNDAGDSTAPTTTNDGGLRFVKLVDGLTDVLVSCAIVPDRARCCIVVERYTTKVPSERYTSGESESSILKQLNSFVSDTITQLHFYAQTLRSHRTQVCSVPSLVHSLIATSQLMRSTESLFLRYAHLSLDEVTPSVFPFLLERLCGALSVFNPCCFQALPLPDSDGTSPAQHVQGFPWCWKEWLQNEPRIDEARFFIVCGFNVEADTAMGSESSATTSAEQKSAGPKTVTTRVIPYLRRDLLVSTTTTEESHNALLAELGLSRSRQCKPYVVLHVSLNEGISVAVFNLRDTDFLLRLLIDAVQEMELKSTLLNDVLLQRLGYSIPSAFDEAGLARNCCGDVTNVLQSKQLSISAASYRRRVNHVRFRASLPPAEQQEAVVVIIEGLFNRGLIVNYVFPIDDAICCLYEECTRYPSLAACAAVVESLINDGYLLEDPASALRPQVSLDTVLPRRTQKRRRVVNCRLADIGGVPADALIACDYHRHILSAHVILEAQNARSGVSESLARLNTLWRTGAHNHLHEFTRIIVQLQLKSKEVFASRVPEFQLRRESWAPGDDLLDPDLPSVDQQDTRYAAPINEVMQNYMNRLRRVYPRMLVIEVSPNDPQYREDPVVTSRLQCRYGKVAGNDGETVVFCPNLYYGVIPIAELIDRHRTAQDRFSQQLPTDLLDVTESAPITSAGLLVVEVGFQVVHYALDFFVIKGERLPPGIEAGIASEFKQTLMFDGAVYDAVVRRYIGEIRAPASLAAERPAQQPLSIAIMNLAKHHPTPPQCSCSAVVPFRITDPNVLRVRSLSPSSATATARRNAATVSKSGSTLVLQGRGGAAAAEGNSAPASVSAATPGSPSSTAGKVTLLVPNPAANTSVLVHAPTGERYLFGGLIHWDSQTLYVLVTPVRLEVAADYASEHHASVVANSLMPLIAQAKQLLFTQLLESTQQERVSAAWEKFLYPQRRSEVAPGGARVFVPHEAPSYDELELVIRNSHRVLLPSFQPVLQQAVEPVEWSGDGSLPKRTQEILFPEYVFRLVRRAASSALRAAGGKNADSNPGALGVAAPQGVNGDAVDEVSRVDGLLLANTSDTSGVTCSIAGKGTIGGYPASRLFQGPPLPDDDFVATFARASPASDYFLVVRCIRAPEDEVLSVVVADTYLCCRAAPTLLWSPAGPVTVLSADQCALMDTFVELLANCIWASIVPHSSQAK